MYSQKLVLSRSCAGTQSDRSNSKFNYRTNGPSLMTTNSGRTDSDSCETLFKPSLQLATAEGAWTDLHNSQTAASMHQGSTFRSNLNEVPTGRVWIAFRQALRSSTEHFTCRSLSGTRLLQRREKTLGKGAPDLTHRKRRRRPVSASSSSSAAPARSPL